MTDNDAGSATVWMVLVIAVVVAVGVAVAGAGAAMVVRHRAAVAADAAALAVAGDVIAGAPAACEQGRRFAAANGSVLTGCQVDGSVATVTVSVRLPGPLARLGSAGGTARAGP